MMGRGEYFLKLYHPEEKGFLVFSKTGAFLGLEKSAPLEKIIDPARQETVLGAGQFNKFFCSFIHRDLPSNIDSPDLFVDFVKKEAEVSGNMNVLDAGAGNGKLLGALKGKGCYLVGLDLVSGKNSCEYDRFVEASVEDIPLESNFFDRVFAVFLLEHVASVENSLSELVRVARKGGTIVIAVPSLGLLDSIKAFFGLDEMTLNPEHFRYFGLISRVPWCYNTKKFLSLAAKDCKIKSVNGIKISKNGIRKTLFKFFAPQTFIVLEKR
ncbi:MAG: class I SAM-dependent methyltransferase [Candidatus Diapherotrites archaeon]